MKTAKLVGNIWGSVFNSHRRSLIIDHRIKATKRVEYVEVSIDDLSVTKLPIEQNWWSELVGSERHYCYAIVYEDRNDPSLNRTLQHHLVSGEVMEVMLPSIANSISNPSVYEVGTEYHQLVLKYLNKQSELPIEYLEVEDKIILSYYLRLRKVHQRFIMLVREDGSVFEACIDEEMDGFAPGAFFLFEKKMCYFKNNNEITVLDI